MHEHPFTGDWTVTNPGNLRGLTEFTIEEHSVTGTFTITAPASDLFLPGLVYDPPQEILTGRCKGRAGGEGTFLVAVVFYGQPPDLQCKVIVFSAGGDGEDNSVGSWTADKKGQTDPPR